MRKKVFHRIPILIICVFTFLSSFAQNKTLHGTVTDDKGVPLTGATVTVKSKNIITKTDADGKFTLSAPPDATFLVITCIGNKPAEVAIGERTSFTVSLSPSVTSLSDVVVIGYGVQKKSDVNGAISSISSTDLENIPQASVDQMMQGKAAGVQVTQNSGQPGPAVSVHIRGITSFSGSEPLYVIDGVAIDGNSATNGIQLTSPSSPSTQETSPSPLAELNPNDIESIDILKDASATAIYGSRGANGVVVITTKKGKLGTGRLDYDGWYGVQEQGKFIKMMNLPQYATLENNLAELWGETPRTEFADPSKLGPGTNWQDAIFRRGPETSHSISISGSNSKTDYYISGGYFDQTGTVIGSSFNRYSMHASVNSQVKDWFKAGTSFNASQSYEDIDLGNSYGIIYDALLQAPDAAVYNADGSFAGPEVVNGQVYGYANAVQQALNLTNNLKRDNVQGNFYGDIKFPLDITLHSEIDGNFDWSDAKTFKPTYSYGALGSTPAFANTQAYLNELDYGDSYWNWVEHLNYNHTFAGKHAITALAGREVWESNYDGIQAATAGFTAGNVVQTLGLGTQTDDQENEPKGSTVMESYIARLIYTYDNKYSITATDRRDRSSNFAPGHQVGYFPGVAVSWRLSEEKFMADVNPIFSNLKIRVGYGTVGNSNTGGGYKYGSAIQPVTTGLGTGFSFYNFSNPNLTWETAIQKNLGIDFGLVHNRIDASFDVYQKSSKNFLFQQPLPAFLSGGTAEYSQAAIVQPPWVNAGQISNKGFEFTINSRNIVQRNFRWTTTAIFSHYTNKVVSLNGFPAIVGSVSTGFGPTIPATYTQAGGPVGEFYGYKTAGIIKTTAQLQYLAAHPQNVLGAPEPLSSDRTLGNAIWTGDILYAGNNNGAPNTEYPLGNPNPNFTYSLTNTFDYKDFELSVFLTGSEGGKVLNAVSFQSQGLYGLYMNQVASVANYWTPENPNSNIPTPRAAFGNNNLVMSDRFLESASYLRIQNVRLSYNLPQNWAKHVQMTHLKAYVSGQNLYVFTKYSGYDPEIGSLNQNPTLQNIDYGRYPAPRVITVGINAEF